ncbi:thiamine-phosphate pyrophosphorylase [Dethiosulfatibacter aminovorans DSM 17477]|uniref:Thiamine-phosphate pyrophosphorylase n=1 Tax=Dethiosulfatibacter aminovorans DSM 17477 TaxID=1121476 RepID=A0A1M6IPG5_9FIRM|nr:thiamine phosphate synthase [Dethiosulfatibacter aminovorans]SHJ36330.1 thiamine-phosphate pyrophosphorylase [Dethiosulfatibacter aminovorans DSM 17477]
MVIFVTSRKLCREPFIERMEKLINGRPYAVMLREKDMDQDAYEDLAHELEKLCRAKGVFLILNNNKEAAEKIRDCSLHLSIDSLREMGAHTESCKGIGASVHSVEEAVEAESLGAEYLVAGHIYATGCKEGVPPRGTGFLREVCRAVSIPVYAIGGVKVERVADIMNAGAAGVCIMNEAMTCDNPGELAGRFWHNISKQKTKNKHIKNGEIGRINN